LQARPWTTPPFDASSALLTRVRWLSATLDARLAEAQRDALPPDDGAALLEAHDALASMGVHDPSFTLQRMPLKRAGERMRVLKDLALCPYRGAFPTTSGPVVE
jgi:hypothetical protein